MEWATFWTAIGAVVTMAGALLAYLYSKKTFISTTYHSHYAALDSMYGDLLKIAIDKPYLRIRGKKHEGREALEYDNYAHLSWCFVESVFDHSRPRTKWQSFIDLFNPSAPQSNPHLLHSWESAVIIETLLHGPWLDNEANSYKFKLEFKQYIKDLKSKKDYNIAEAAEEKKAKAMLQNPQAAIG